MRGRIKNVPLPKEVQEKIAAIKHSLFGPLMAFEESIEIIRSNDNAHYPTYVVIDAIHRSDISVLFDAYDLNWRCLWKGESAERFALQAPYIAELREGSEFVDWLLLNGFGKGWGIFLRSHFSLDALAHHLRKFNQVYSEVDKTWLMFRYYSPTTVNQLLPYLPGSDFVDFMRPISQLVSENGNASLLVVR